MGFLRNVLGLTEDPDFRRPAKKLVSGIVDLLQRGERKIKWDFLWERKQLYTVHCTPDLGTKDTLRIVWEMRIRELKLEAQMLTSRP